jgi:hypothetical protein
MYVGILIVAICHKQVIGFCTMEKADFEMFSDQFDVEEFISLDIHESLHKDNYLLITHLIMNPLFQHFLRPFIEVLRDIYILVMVLQGSISKFF